MTEKLRAAAQQTLVWLEWFHKGNSMESPRSSTQCMMALRAALAEPQDQHRLGIEDNDLTVAYMVGYSKGKQDAKAEPHAAAPEAQAGEPQRPGDADAVWFEREPGTGMPSCLVADNVVEWVSAGGGSATSRAGSLMWEGSRITSPVIKWRLVAPRITGDKT